MVRRQQVHVGETVLFDFVLTDGLGRFVPPYSADEYGVLYVGRDRIETEPDEAGHFSFAHRFNYVKSGTSMTADAAVFQQRGNRDFIKVQGEWLLSTSPYEEPDRRVAGDRIILEIYQTRITLSIARPPLDLDPDSGVMRIVRDDGTASSVYVDRPGRPGFSIAGPDPGGYYQVTYEPDGDQLNPTGSTRIEFTVYDVGGQRHAASLLLPTP